MSAAFLRKYNTAITAGTAQSIKIPMIKRAAVDFALGADWTPASGDVKVSKDGGAAANIATLPAAVAMGNGAYWEFVFSGAELTCGTLVVTISDSAAKVVEDQAFIIETFGNASAFYIWDMSLANLPANVTQLLGTAFLTPTVAGTPDVNALQVSGSAAAATNLKNHALRAVPVTFQTSGGTTTAAALVNVDGAAASATNDVYNGRLLIFSAPSGLKDQVCQITAYVGATKIATITAVTTAPDVSAVAVMV